MQHPTVTAPYRKPVPTPRQFALRKAVQHAQPQGVSLRGIARELGLSRNTVRRYAYALSPPANRSPVTPTKSTTQRPGVRQLTFWLDEDITFGSV